MKLKNIKYVAGAMLLAMGMTSCEDFLDRPVEDNYNTDNYYVSDNAILLGTSYLYNSPWYDFQRGFIKVGEVMAGNMYWGSSPYMNFSVNGTDQDLVNMSYSLWAVVAHAGNVYNALQGTGNSDAIKQALGECLTWKAMAYFYLVRSFGDVPIIHDNAATMLAGDYNQMSKVQKADVYEYILLTLEKAMELLPKTKNTNGRIDYYGAEGLYAKVLLTAAGVTGSLNQDYLKKASEASLDVIQNSGRKLMENYEDIFRGKNNISDESLIAWRWAVSAQWTSQNTLQSDLMPEGFDEFGDCWGGWGGPSADLQDAFGYDVMENPNKRIETDARRKATMMGAGDVYSYFWRDTDLGNGQKGFDILKFYYDKKYNKAATGEFQGPCGVQNVKHAYGNTADHLAEMGTTPARMAYSLATHILRLADVYLVHAEAEVLQGKNTSSTALAAFNAVRQRSVPSAVDKTTLSFDDIWKERRLELAGEGDRWYDFVRRAYYDVQSCIDEIKSQRRNAIWGCNSAYKTFYTSKGNTWNTEDIQYDTETPAPNVTAASFVLPFPNEDVALNPNLASSVEPVHVDVRATFSY